MRTKLWRKTLTTIAFLAGLTATSVAGRRTAQAREPNLRVREPAVAGLFYPADKDALARMIDRLLAQAKPLPVENLRALVCPHAGYEYSGPTAAFAYRLLKDRDVRTVFILAPSHYADFAGASIPNVDAYRTPLGLVPLSPKAKVLAGRKPFVLEPACAVQRPPWWTRSSRPAPPPGEDTPDTWEHSAEVQVPFLQRALKNFQIVPIVFGSVDPAQAARALADQIDTRTVIVASSDLSHYYPYDVAKEKDKRCVSAICDVDVERMQSQEACGRTPILTLLYLAKARGWKAQLLDARNSGDTAGDKSGVVGYAAIAFYEPGKTAGRASRPTPAAAPPAATSAQPAARSQNQPNENVRRTTQSEFTTEEGKLLVKIARTALTDFVAKERTPQIDEAKLPPKLSEPKGCFVTLTKHGELRGCVGQIFPKEALYKAVVDGARNAALFDTRFTPVRAEELDKIEVEVSVLTVPQPLAFRSPEDLLSKLHPGKDGVVLKIGSNMATYLPQVWEQLPQKEAFLSHLSEKAGCPPDAWRTRDAQLLIYHVQAFKEAAR